MQHLLPEPGKPMPDPHGGPGCPVSPEGPHLLCPPPSSGGGGVAIPSGMVHVTPCRVTWCGGDQHQVLDHTIEAMVAKKQMNLLFLQSEGPEKVALKEDSQMEEGTLVEVLLEMVGIISTKALAVAWG